MAGFGGSVKLTGESEYKKALQQITQNLKEVSSEMKVVSSQYDKNDKSTSAVKAKTEALNKVLEQQKNRLQVLKDKYEEMSQKTGVSETALSDLRIQMNKAQADINKTTKELDALGNEAEDSGKQAEDAGKGGYTVFKNILANLATQAIQSCIAGLKKLGDTFVDIGKQSIEAYGEFEQLEGGVKKLFGDEDAQAVMANAQRAFSTVGMSANKYMENVTGFSASLINSLNGNTEEAVSIADMAMQDIADNANTFGKYTAEELTGVYQALARGNYQTLDNLSLGFAGTKTGMEQLIAKANELAKAQGEAGNLTIDSYADMIKAIHIVQQEWGITGTTANEASTTIQGSMNAMKSAWENMLTGIADDNANFSQLVDDFISTLISEDGQGGVLAKLVPRITTVINGISQLLQTLLPTLIQTVVPIINDNLPIILKAVSDALKAILELLPTIMPTIQKLIPDIVTELINDLPMIIDTGIQLILALVQGIIDAMPQLINQIPVLVEQVAKTIVQNLPKILKTGLELIASLIAGIYQAMGGLVAPAVKVVATVVQAIGNAISSMVDAGMNLVRGIWSGISDGLWWIKNKISGWVGNVTSFIKNLFGIHSPSTLFRDEIGTNLALGIGEGFSDEMEDVSNMMADSIPTNFDVSPTIKSSGQSQMYNMVEAFKEALSEMKIVMDDQEMGQFVENTVTKAIYA